MNDHRLFIVHKNNNIRLETSQTNFSFPVINLMIQRRYYLYEYLVLYMPMLIWDKIIGNIFIRIHIQQKLQPQIILGQIYYTLSPVR